MKRIKKYKKDLIMLLIYSTVYIVLALLLTRGSFLFASTTDFEMQHYVFPEYFRNLFYETKALLPDFALNLGGGQNIYNFSYYGLLNPIILISYFLPMVPMIYYLIGASFLLVVSSTFLFYKFLQHHNFKNSTCITVSLLFLFATPILYHAKRHIMFINYFPFLIGGLFGIDKFLQEQKKGLLIACTTAMIFTSFYYSVSGIVVLGIYGLYEYQKLKGSKGLLKFLPYFAIPFLIAILTSAILWLPTAYTLLSGRGESIKTLELWTLFLPNFKFLYTAYSPGLTIVEFLLISLLVIDKDIQKETRKLAFLLMIIFLFPIFNFFLNGTLYVNSKSLIPFLPLALLLLAISLENIPKNTKKIQVYLVLSTCLITLFSSATEILIPIKYEKNDSKNYQKLINKITKEDQTFYRINNSTYLPSSLNRVYNMKEYKSSIYSSTQNKNYQTWVQKEIKNNIFYRNNMMLTLTGNPITEALMSEKYIISKEKLDQDYHFITKENNLYLYENELALPLIYASNKTLTKKQMKDLNFPERSIATYTKEIPEKNKWEKVNFRPQTIKNLKITQTKSSLKIKAKENAKITLVPETNLEGKIVFINFKNKFNKGCHHEKNDQTITINNIKNKLTCRDWKYHNQNKTFHYVLLSPKKIEITFSKAYYKLGEIEVVAIQKSLLENTKKEITAAKINQKKTKGDRIKATIEVTKKTQVETSIPYDQGFKVKVDNQEVSYHKSLQNTLAFPIKKGKHQIEITYQAPYKTVGVVLSLIGILSWITLTKKQPKKTSKQPKLDSKNLKK